MIIDTLPKKYDKRYQNGLSDHVDLYEHIPDKFRDYWYDKFTFRVGLTFRVMIYLIELSLGFRMLEDGFSVSYTLSQLLGTIA